MGSTEREILHRGDSTITVEILQEYAGPVAVKRPAQHHESRQYRRSLEREYEMTRSLDSVAGIRRVLEWREAEDRPALILEYVSGRPLREHVASTDPDLRSKLELATELARILRDIHKQGIIHLGISGDNILIGDGDSVVHLIDLGAARRRNGAGHHEDPPDLALGALRYIAPEQTGRINRIVDERSDLYSLGVVLYELVTGQPPFHSRDPIELIHQHLARTPAPPSEVSPGIPAVLDAIIGRLLRKSAEDRYQSAAGVQRDLETCLQRLAPGDLIPDFPLGAADHAGRLVFLQSLYGREDELQLLFDAFATAHGDESMLVLVGGYSGTGKTALVEELRRPVAVAGGLFARGKFDQYLRTTPYSAITQAFTDWVTTIQTEPATEVERAREAIQSAVGELGGVLMDVIPALQDLIGVQPEVPRLGGQESENRFNLIFVSFLQAIATAERPLVLFVDDLQWIDRASLGLLEVIRAGVRLPGLLLIGAYRDNEVDDDHPLAELIAGAGARVLILDNLRERSIATMLADTLGASRDIETLSAAIHERTRGNPFFVRRLLSSLHGEGCVRYDTGSNSWLWNPDDIASVAIADNVAELLAGEIEQLRGEEIDLLNTAACIGNRFDVATLAMVSGFTEPKVVGRLEAALSGKFVNGSDSNYEFVHDQVQRAAYGLVDTESRTRKHLEIARALLEINGDPERNERIFEIANHYGLSTELVTDAAESLHVARVNLAAGRRSKANSAFAAAATYLQRSLDLLGEAGWRDQYPLTLAVGNELIDARYLNTEHDHVRTLFETIRDHADRDVDAWIAYRTLIMAHVARNEPGDAITLGEAYLESLHVAFEPELANELSADEFLALSTIEDEEMRAALEILMALTTPIIFAAPERLASLFCTMLNIIGRHGNSEVSSFAASWHATLLCSAGKYREGNAFGQLAMDLLAKYPVPGMASKVVNMQCAWIRHWESSVHDLIAPLEEYHRIGLEEGEIEWCLYNLGNHMLLLWGVGASLDAYASTAAHCVGLCEDKNQEITFLICSIFAQGAANLRDETLDASRLEGHWFSEQYTLPRLAGNDMLLSFYRSVQIALCYLFGDPEGAREHAVEALKTRHGLLPHYLYTKISFYGALAYVAGSGNEAARQEQSEVLVVFEGELKTWAESAPMNYAHQYRLLLAEKCRLAGDHWPAVQHYEAAREGARTNGFVHDEALANELFGRFWLDQGNEGFASVCLAEALGCYRAWGAVAKADDLQARYAQLIVPSSVSVVKTGPDSVDPDVVAPTASILDLDSILKACHTLTGEIDLPKLLAKLIVIVIENAGAERGLLLLPEGDDWFIEAEGCIDSDHVTIERSDNVANSRRLPATIIHHVSRTREPAVLDDVLQDERFSRDPYVEQKRVRSALCLPLVNQGKLVSILYLENNLAPGVFSEERVELLDLLSSQMALALENARLYSRLEERIAQRTVDLTEAGRMLEQIRTSEERYDLAVAGSAAGIWDWDLRTDEIFYSDRLKELLGLAPDEMSSSLEEFWTRLHPDHVEAVRVAVDRHLLERIPFQIDYRLRTKAGQYRWFHARGQALFDESGKPLRMSGSISDITRRKQSEDELRSSEERFRLLMERSPLATELLAPDGRILKVNAAWRRLWDVTEEQAAAAVDAYNMLADPQLVDLGIMPIVEKAFAGEDVILPPIEYDAGRTAEELGIDPFEAPAPWIQCHLSPIKDETGEVQFVVNIYMDLSELKQTEMRARRHQEALARHDRATVLGQLTGSIAHELNQPLTGILSNAQAAEMLLASGKWETEEMAEIMAEIVDDTKRGGEVIRNLRDLYREQKGDFAAIDVNTVVEETCHMLRSEFVVKDVDLSVECEPSLPPVSGNRVQLQQIVVNLIMNAIQAMAGQPRWERKLRIMTSGHESEIRIWVEDRGPGIDPEHLDRIFEPLATWKPGGTGMGLAICSSIMEAHCGTMWAENMNGGGARVGFSLSPIEGGQQA